MVSAARSAENERGEADAVDRDAVANVETGSERGRSDGDAGRSCGWRDGEKRSSRFDKSSEHGFSLTDLMFWGRS
jgi:hypothetical protein